MAKLLSLLTKQTCNVLTDRHKGGSGVCGKVKRGATQCTQSSTQAVGINTLAKIGRWSGKLNKDSFCSVTARTHTRTMLCELATGTSETAWLHGTTQYTRSYRLAPLVTHKDTDERTFWTQRNQAYTLSPETSILNQRDCRLPRDKGGGGLAWQEATRLTFIWSPQEEECKDFHHAFFCIIPI